MNFTLKPSPAPPLRPVRNPAALARRARIVGSSVSARCFFSFTGSHQTLIQVKDAGGAKGEHCARSNVYHRARSKSIQGWLTGAPAESEDALRFSELSGVRPLIETYPLDQAARAYARMLSGDAQFRVVLTM